MGLSQRTRHNGVIGAVVVLTALFSCCPPTPAFAGSPANLGRLETADHGTDGDWAAAPQLCWVKNSDCRFRPACLNPNLPIEFAAGSEEEEEDNRGGLEQPGPAAAPVALLEVLSTSGKIPEHFENCEELGRGNHATVFKCTDTLASGDANGGVVAVKEYGTRPKQFPYSVREAEREYYFGHTIIQDSKYAARVLSKEVVEPGAANNEEGTVCISQEFGGVTMTKFATILSKGADGRPAYTITGEGARMFMDVGFYTAMVRQLLEIVQYISSLGLVHGDINPNNLVYGEVPGHPELGPRMRLIDYGTVFCPDSWVAPCGAQEGFSNRNHYGEFEGTTMLYAPPEAQAPEPGPAGVPSQWSFTGAEYKDCTHCFDMWSVGVVMLEWAAGYPLHALGMNVGTAATTESCDVLRLPKAKTRVTPAIMGHIDYRHRLMYQRNPSSVVWFESLAVQHLVNYILDTDIEDRPTPAKALQHILFTNNGVPFSCDGERYPFKDEYDECIAGGGKDTAKADPELASEPGSAGDAGPAGSATVADEPATEAVGPTVVVDGPTEPAVPVAADAEPQPAEAEPARDPAEASEEQGGSSNEPAAAEADAGHQASEQGSDADPGRHLAPGLVVEEPADGGDLPRGEDDGVAAGCVGDAETGSDTGPAMVSSGSESGSGTLVPGSPSGSGSPGSVRSGSPSSSYSDLSPSGSSPGSLRSYSPSSDSGGDSPGYLRSYSPTSDASSPGAPADLTAVLAKGRASILRTMDRFGFRQRDGKGAGPVAVHADLPGIAPGVCRRCNARFEARAAEGCLTVVREGSGLTTCRNQCGESVSVTFQGEACRGRRYVLAVPGGDEVAAAVASLVVPKGCEVHFHARYTVQ